MNLLAIDELAAKAAASHPSCISIYVYARQRGVPIVPSEFAISTSPNNRS
ncbi:hypothetical protein [Chamaesiphon minutus]|nr:hypothetical protein [Chamaesiphon minutus]